MDERMPVLSPLYTDALTYAAHLHRRHRRKGSGVPYLSHLMSVSVLVLEDGGSEEEAIAGLLHDALEDCADQTSAEEIERRYGFLVREIVEACTDTLPGHAGGEKAAWKPRKTRYLDHLRNGSFPYRVSLADKLHNARSILRDLRIEGEAVWNRFSQPKEQTLWYYRSLVDAFQARGARGYLIEELDRTVTELEERSMDADTRRRAAGE